MAEQAGLWGYIPDFLKRWAIGHGRDPIDFVPGTSPYGEGLSGYVPSNQGTQVASLAPSASQQNNINSGLFYNAPETSDQTRADNFGRDPHPYKNPGPATLKEGFDLWKNKNFGPTNYSTFHGKAGINPFPSIKYKLDPANKDEPRTGWSGAFGDFMRVGMSPILSKIPGSSLLSGAAGILNSLGAYHDYNPSRDSGLFVNPDNARMTWDSMDPGGGGEQGGALNTYNSLMKIHANDPNFQLKTTDGKWVNAGELARYIKNQHSDEGTGIVQTDIEFLDNPTNFDQMPSKFTSGGESMTNADALRSLETRHGDAWNSVFYDENGNHRVDENGFPISYDEGMKRAEKEIQGIKLDKLDKRADDIISRIDDSIEKYGVKEDFSKEIQELNTNLEALDNSDQAQLVRLYNDGKISRTKYEILSQGIRSDRLKKSLIKEDPNKSWHFWGNPTGVDKEIQQYYKDTGFYNDKHEAERRGLLGLRPPENFTTDVFTDPEGIWEPVDLGVDIDFVPNPIKDLRPIAVMDNDTTDDYVSSHSYEDVGYYDYGYGED